MTVFGFDGGPRYRGTTPRSMFEAAMAQPMSVPSTLFDQAKGGILESFGLGTAIKDFTIPEGQATWQSQIGSAFRLANPLTTGYEISRRTAQAFREESPALSEDAYKSSPFFRDDIPWDARMTEDRAAALAMGVDARKVREFYAAKRPIWSFVGNMAGQAFDPINYIPVGGAAVKAAQVARFGKIGGTAVAGALDAAGNTAIFSIATADRRASYGDDVSWQATVSEIATAALIGGAFGGIAGAWGGRGDAKSRQTIEDRLATLKTTQEARIALNEAIGGLARGEDVALGPNASSAMERVQQEIIAYHGSPHEFDRFDSSRIGTGEGAQAYGYGLYFAESEGVAKSYRDALADPSTPEEVAAQYLSDFGNRDAAIAKLADHAQGGMGWSSEHMANVRGALQLLKSNADVGGKAPGSMYKVSINADPEGFLDWDKLLSEQSERVRDALDTTLPPEYAAVVKADGGREGMTGATAYKLLSRTLGSDKAASDALRQAGLPGIRYLDAGSRGAGDGSRNLVVFDDGRVSVTAKNGQPIDLSPPRPEPIPEDRQPAETRIAKPDDYKAMSAQYGVDPEAGTFVEEADVSRVRTEGRLTADDEADLADAQTAFEDGKAYGEALKSVVSCLLL